MNSILLLPYIYIYFNEHGNIYFEDARFFIFFVSFFIGIGVLKVGLLRYSKLREERYSNHVD